MPTEYDESATATASRTRRVSGLARAGVSYALFGLGIAALVSFFAPHIGLDALAWHAGILPTIAAPTEGDAVINVSPLIVGVVAAFVSVWIR